MTALALLLIILLLMWLLLPYIRRWLVKWLVRRVTGQTINPGRRNRRQREYPDERQTHERAPERRPADLMREVAEDVNFTEYHEFSQTDIDIEENKGNKRTSYHETQVEDALYTEIKTDKH